MNGMKQAASSLRLPALVLGLGLVLGGCNMDIDAPDRVMDADLDSPEALLAITAGAVADYAEAYVVPGGGGTIMAGAMLTDELVHSGTWIGLRGLSDGESLDDWVESQSRWAEPSQARWTAETGLERVSEILVEDGQDPDSHRYIAVLALHAGMSNVMLGDNFCQAVINGGGYEPFTAFFDRALPYFDQAIAVGTAAGDGELSGDWDDGDDVAMAARIGKSRALMQLGQWTDAVDAVASVPTDFVYHILYDDNAGIDNDTHWWGFRRDETTVWGTPYQFWGDNVDESGDGDPRVPYDIRMASGDTAQSGDGRRPFFRQVKFPSYDADIGGMKGTEARLIEAEAALVANGVAAIPTVVSRINEVRAEYSGVPALDPLTVTSVDDAWIELMKERGIELWLEGKRLGDWRRWALGEPGVDNATVWEPFRVVRDEATGEPASEDVWQRPILDTEVWQERGDICIQVSKNEKDSNPNIN